MFGKPPIARNDSDDEGDLPLWLKAENDGLMGSPVVTRERTPLVPSSPKQGNQHFGHVEEDYGGTTTTDYVDNIGGNPSWTQGSTSSPDGGDGGSVNSANSLDGDEGHDFGEESEDDDVKEERNWKRKLRGKKKSRKKGRQGPPRRSCCHMVFVFVNVLAVTSCVTMISAQILPLVFVKLDWLNFAFRVYVTFFCIIFVIAEMEWPVPFIKTSQSLLNWFSKGFLFTFFGIIGMEEANAHKVQNAIQKYAGDDGFGTIDWGFIASWIVELSSLAMVGVGVLYMLLGMMCMKRIRDRCVENYVRWQEEYESRYDDIEDVRGWDEG